ncbi:MAG: nuclear transport factor 2 family protein [Myxococcota bacterium]
MDPRLNALLDQQEIRDVISQYCRGIDRRDFERVRACYHPDGTDEHGSFTGDVDAFVAWVGKLTARYRFTMHLVGQVLIEFEEVATGSPNVAAVETVGVSIHRSDEEKAYLNLATGFRYLDRFERRAGGNDGAGAWKIATRKAIGEWSVQLPADAWWEIPDAQSGSRRDSSDPLYALLAALQPGNRTTS